MKRLIDEMLDVYTEDTSGLSDEQYAAIGRIAVESAHLESELTTILLKLASAKADVGAIFLDGLMLGRKLELLDSVVATRLIERKEKLPAFEKLICEIRANNTQRATAIHGTWVTMTLGDLAGGTIPNPRAIKSKTSKTARRELKIDEAKALSVSIRKSRRDLWSLTAKTWPQLFALRLPGIPAKHRR